MSLKKQYLQWNVISELQMLVNTKLDSLLCFHLNCRLVLEDAISHVPTPNEYIRRAGSSSLREQQHACLNSYPMLFPDICARSGCGTRTCCWEFYECYRRQLAHLKYLHFYFNELPQYPLYEISWYVLQPVLRSSEEILVRVIFVYFRSISSYTIGYVPQLLRRTAALVGLVSEEMWLFPNVFEYTKSTLKCHPRTPYAHKY